MRVERGTPLRGAALTPAQKDQLYREGFVILQDALPSSLTTACKARRTVAWMHATEGSIED